MSTDIAGKDVATGDIADLHALKGSLLIAEGTISIPAAATSQPVAFGLAGASGASSAMSSLTALVSVTQTCFVRRNADPAGDGTDMLLWAGSTYRAVGLTPNDTLHFTALDTPGSAYITPEA